MVRPHISLQFLFFFLVLKTFGQYHTLYANNENWVNMTHPLLVSMFPVPQKYFVPRRIRETYIPRLEAVGLWYLNVEEKVIKKSFQNQEKSLPVEDIKSNTTVSRAFQFEKVYSFSFVYSFISECYEQVIVKARAELDIYHQLLDDKEYVFQNQYVSGVFRMFKQFIFNWI